MTAPLTRPHVTWAASMCPLRVRHVMGHGGDDADATSVTATGRPSRPPRVVPASGGSCRPAVEREGVGVVAVAARRADVLGPDARPLLDDVVHRHAVTPAQLVVVLEPGEDLGGLDGGVDVAALLRLLEQPARCEPGLLLDRVEVRPGERRGGMD